MSDKIKELEEKINTIAYNINYLNSLMHSLGQGFTKYILWKGDEPEFKKHLENTKKDDKLKENDGKTEEKKA